MKILFVTHENPSNILGGLGFFSREYTKELKKYHEVKILYYQLNDGIEEIDKSIIDYHIRAMTDFQSLNYESGFLETTLNNFPLVLKILQEFQPDIIHCNDRQTYLPFRFFPNVVFSLHLSMPCLYGLKNLDDKFYYESKIEKFASLHSQALIVYSEFMKKEVLEKINGLCSPFVLPLGIDINNYYNIENKNKIVVSYFGRMENIQKGTDEFIQAINHIDKDLIKDKKVEFNIYTRANFDFYNIENFPMFKNIKFVEGDEKYKALAETDIVIAPSFYEPFGYVGLEALASNCILLCPDGTGMDEYLDDCNHISIKPNRIDINKKLEDTIKNFNSLSIIKRNNRISVEKFTLENSVKKHIEVYENIKNGRIKNIKIVNSEKFKEIKENNLLLYNINYKTPNRTKQKYNIVKDLIKNSNIFVIAASSDEIDVYKEKFIDITPNNYLKKNWQNDPIENLCIKDKNYGTVIALDVLEHTIDPSIALLEAIRITNKQLILSIPFNIFALDHLHNFNSPQNILDFLYNFNLKDNIKETYIYEMNVDKDIIKLNEKAEQGILIISLEF